MIKRILSILVVFLAMLVLSPTTYVSAEEDSAILFVTSPHKTELVGNGTSIDLVLNTMGSHVTEIHAEFIIQGLNENPGYGTHLSGLNGFIFGSYDVSKGEEGLRVMVNMRSKDPNGVNGGSGTMTIFNTAFSPTKVGTIYAYIDTDRSFIRYTDHEGMDFRNYSPSTRPYLVNVISESGNQVTVTPPPQKLTPSPATYDRDFEQLTKEFAAVKKEVGIQGQRISILEQIVATIQQFFERLSLFFK